MKRLTCYYSFVCFICLLGCSDRQPPMTNVLTDEMTQTPTTSETEMAPVEVIEQITFDNVLALEVGKKYKLRPTSFDESMASMEGNDSVVLDIYFGSIGLMEGAGLLPGLPDDTRKVIASFKLDPTPYAQTLEGKPIFGKGAWEEGEADEIVIEIKRVFERGERSSGGGRGRDPLTYFFVNYGAVAIENLTNPDITFEYE